MGRVGAAVGPAELGGRESRRVSLVGLTTRMPIYSYQAVNPGRRRPVRGDIEAPTSAVAIDSLRAQGLHPTSMELFESARPDARAGWKAWRNWRGIAGKGVRLRRDAAPIPSKGVRRKRVPAVSVALWTRQLATLLAAGMPVLRSLETLARQERVSALKEVITHLSEVVRSGGSLSAGMTQRPHVFDRLYTNMVRAGEAGGMLDEVLERLAQFLEKAQRIKGKVIAAMAYPVIIVVVATAIVAALTAFVVPKFEQIFLTQLRGRSLPGLTQVVIGISRFVSEHFILTLLGLGGAGFAALWCHRQPWGKRWLDRVALRLPVAGEFFLKVAVARFARTFGTLMGAGVPILEALVLTRQATANEVVAGALEAIHVRVEAGQSMASSLSSTKVFPPLLPAMVEVGEATGKLPEMLGRIADIYEAEVDTAVASVTSVIEPIMIVVMAVVVGTIVIALFLPMIEIIKGLSGG